MIIVDANLLIYAYNDAAPQHESARRWLETVMSGAHAVRLPWSVIQAFLRLTTARGALAVPLTMPAAIRIVDQWLASPAVDTLEAGPQHWTILREVLTAAHVRGPMVTDAHLAALTIEQNATLYTADADFRRFDGLRVVNPLA